VLDLSSVMWCPPDDIDMDDVEEERDLDAIDDDDDDGGPFRCGGSLHPARDARSR